MDVALPQHHAEKNKTTLEFRDLGFRVSHYKGVGNRLRVFRKPMSPSQEPG